MNAYKLCCRKVRVDTLLDQICALHTYVLYHIWRPLSIIIFNKIILPHYLNNSTAEVCFPSETVLINASAFRKRSAGGFPAVACTASLDIHMVCRTLIIRIINTFYRLTVDADRSAGMRQRAGKRIIPLSFLRKAVAAGVVTIAGMFAANHDIAFTTIAVCVIGTVFHTTF